MGKGYTSTKSKTYEDHHGKLRTKNYTVWTQKGRRFIYDILKKNGEEAKMVKAYSNFNAAMYIGTGIAALLGAGLYEKLGSHVLLIAEFVIYSTAILLLSCLPNAHRPVKSAVVSFKERLKKFWVAVRYILKSRKYCYLVLFSGFMVGVSHFFFWSFQPLMKS